MSASEAVRFDRKREGEDWAKSCVDALTLSHTLFPAPYRSFRLNLPERSPAADENKIRLAFTATHTGNLSQQIFEIAQH